MVKAKFDIRRKCPICNSVFVIRTIDSVYCSLRCSKIAYKRKKDKLAKEERLNKLAKNIPDIKKYLTVNEAVALFAVERGTLYRMIHLGKIPSINLGKRQTRIKRTNLEKLFEFRQVAREQASIPITKLYSMEPKDCYTIGEISKRYRIHDSSVYAHIRKYSIPTRQIGNYVYVPKSEIDELYKSMEL